MQKEICVWKRIESILRKRWHTRLLYMFHVKHMFAPSALKEFSISFLPSAGIHSCLLSLSPVSSFSAGRKVARKALLITYLGRIRPKQGQHIVWLKREYASSAWWSEKWTKKQTADLTAEQRHLALRLPAKTSRSNWSHTQNLDFACLYIPGRSKQNWHDKCPFKKCGCQQKCPLKKCGYPQKYHVPLENPGHGCRLQSGSRFLPYFFRRAESRTGELLAFVFQMWYFIHVLKSTPSYARRATNGSHQSHLLGSGNASWVLCSELRRSWVPCGFNFLCDGDCDEKEIA